MFAHALLALMALTPLDQTVPAPKGTKLDITNFAGDVNIKVWDKDAVRVEVNHSDRETVDIKQADQVVTIRSRSLRGPSRSLDYVLTVPSWMAISVKGTYADVTAEGVGGDVSVDTTRGDIKVRGGNGFISLKSVDGEIALDKAKGRIEVRTVNEGMRLADLSGDLSAETTNGSIILDRIDSSNVDLYTVNGNISYDGAIKDKGAYRLTTHNGMIGMALPEKANTTLTVRTYNGGFKASFPLKLGDDQNPRKRFTVTLGNGSARVELESFGGTILLRRPGEPRPEVERERRRRSGEKEKEKEKDKEKDHDGAVKFDIMQHARHEAMAAMPEAMEEAMAAMPQAIDEAISAIPQAIEEAIAAIPQAIDEDMAASHGALMELNHLSPMHPTPHPAPNPRPRRIPRER